MNKLFIVVMALLGMAYAADLVFKIVPFNDDTGEIVPLINEAVRRYTGDSPRQLSFVHQIEKSVTGGHYRMQLNFAADCLLSDTCKYDDNAIDGPLVQFHVNGNIKNFTSMTWEAIKKPWH